MVTRIINTKATSTRGFEHLYPFESRFAGINGHNLHYLDQGSGRPVLMIHGNPTWSFYFRHLVQDLSRDHRVLVPDHIGCGLSDKPGISDYPYTLESRVKDLDLLIKGLNLQDPVSLVVHDWGGMIGMAWALENPDRIDRLVITNTSGFLLPKGKRFPLRLWLIKYLTAFAVPAVLGLNIFSRAALVMAPRHRLANDVRKGLTAPYNSWQNRVATLRFVQDIPLTSADTSYALAKSVDERLRSLAAKPMQILWGKHDFVFDITFYNEWKRRFPKAEHHLFDDAGHYLFEDKPMETAALIRRFFE